MEQTKSYFNKNWKLWRPKDEENPGLQQQLNKLYGKILLKS